MHVKTTAAAGREVKLHRQAHTRRTIRTLAHAATCNGPHRVKRIRERMMRHELDLIACEIIRARRDDPKCRDFDSREWLYMRAAVLQRQIGNLYTDAEG